MGDWFFIGLTAPFRLLGALWPSGGCGCLAIVLLGLMVLGALY